MKQRGKILFLVLAFAFVLILFSNFSSAATLKVTEEHPFLINGEWILAKQLQVGDELTTVDGKKVRIKSIKEVIPKDNFPVYNLEAGVYHDFVVCGEDNCSNDSLGVVVHNSNLQGGVCFTGDTLISMADGTVKKIEDLIKGDKVISFNFTSNLTEVASVTEISERLSENVYIINEKIKVTANHPFWTVEKGWTAIDYSEIEEHPEVILSELKIGYHFLDYAGNLVKVESIKKLPGTFKVYNLVDVGANHNYFAEDVLVHNTGNPCAREEGAPNTFRGWLNRFFPGRFNPRNLIKTSHYGTVEILEVYPKFGIARVIPLSPEYSRYGEMYVSLSQMRDNPKLAQLFSEFSARNIKLSSRYIRGDLNPGAEVYHATSSKALVGIKETDKLMNRESLRVAGKTPYGGEGARGAMEGGCNQYGVSALDITGGDAERLATYLSIGNTKWNPQIGRQLIAKYKSQLKDSPEGAKEIAQAIKQQEDLIVKFDSSFSSAEKSYFEDPFGVLIKYKDPQNAVVKRKDYSLDPEDPEPFEFPLIPDSDIRGELLMQDTSIKDLIFYCSPDEVSGLQSYLGSSADVRPFTDLDLPIPL